MANPFEGTITGKNTSHTNQEFLRAVFIPRSTSSIKEVLNNVTASINYGSGSITDYTSEGLLVCGNTSGVHITASISSFSITGEHTVIVCGKHVTSSGSTDNFAGVNCSSATYVSMIMQLDGYTSRLAYSAWDGTNGTTGGFNADFPDGHYVAIAIRTQTGAQNARFRSASSLNADGGITGTTADSTLSGTGTLNDNNGQLNQLWTYVNSDFRWQYTLVYDDYLSNADIDAIIADPGNVVLLETDVFQLAPTSSVVATGHATLTGDPDAYTKYWRVPSNAGQGTTGRMIVFAAGNPPTTVAYEGAVTADANGNFNLLTSAADAAGTKRFAVVHAWNGVTGTTSIYGGPGISEVIVV